MPTLPGLIVVLALAQYYPQPRVRVPVQPNVNPQGTEIGAVATFNGAFKSATKKYLMITLEDGNVMQIYTSHTTKFIRDGQPAKVSDFQSDENVTVEASRDAQLNLLAVRVEAVKAPKAEKKSEQ
jgi:hypothetical protein